MPALALFFLAFGTSTAERLKNPATTLNTIGVVSLEGRSPARPATLYVGLAAQLPGTYRLDYGAPALPAALPQLSAPIGFSPRSAAIIHSTPLGMDLQEASPTSASFLSLKRWATRDMVLDTSLNIPGSIQSHLRLNRAGEIVGTIRNGTALTIEDPVVVAGQSIRHLARFTPGATVRVHLVPDNPFFTPEAPTIWDTAYGSTGSDFTDGFGGFGFGDCCSQGPAAPDVTMSERERNAVSVLSRSQTLPPAAGVSLAGWTRQPLGHFTVGGAVPRRRDLTLLVGPLGVALPSHGTFSVRPGMVAAHLVDIQPRAPRAGCYSAGSCSGFGGWGGFGGRDNSGQISVGPGGSLTFELDLPSNRHVSYQKLALSPGSRLDNLGPGSIYDWRSGRWVAVDFFANSVQLADAGRFVSPQGRVLVRLRATSSTGDLSISDQYHAVTLSGRGVVS